MTAIIVGIRTEAAKHSSKNHRRIPQVTVDLFFRSALPPVESGLVDKVIHHLVEDELLVLGDNPKWANFPVRPSDCDGTENKVFRAFSDVYEDIIAAYKRESPNRKETIELFQRPDTKIPLDDRNTSCPDGYLVVTDDRGTHNWKDIAMTCEYKKGTGLGDKADNARRILWNMHHSMRNSYQRFTYGLTIEDFTVRVRFCDRSENMVSQPFELDKEPRLLVHLFLALSFATRSELGFDPTIEYLEDDKIRISVHTKRAGKLTVIKYIAHVRNDVLAKYGADPMNGRGTRVWRVYEEGKPGTFYVLKDVWVNSDRTLEGDFLRDFENDIEVSGCAEDLEQFKEAFMTVVADGIVMIDSDKEDRTLELNRRGIQPRESDAVTFYSPWHDAQTESNAKLIPHTKQILFYSISDSSEGDSSESDSSGWEIRFCPRMHYRIVVQELGKPLQVLKDMREFLGCLPKVVDGLELLHKYNRLHRDISTGNVIVCYNEASVASTVKLSDLECGRKGVEGGHGDVRTGTYEFMAVEVYRAAILEASKYARPPEPFRHNVLHELESVWWMALWQFLHEYKSLSGRRSSKDSVKLKVHRAKLFNRASEVDRLAVLINDVELRKVFASLPRSQEITKLVRRFTSYGSHIHRSYKKLESQWNDRDQLFLLFIQEFRQFQVTLDMVEDVSVSD